nr:hypothetical protein [Tanacetum cinerariifolium]
MEMEPGIENMTLNEYLEYEAEMERRSWRNDQSKSIPKKYEGRNLTLLIVTRVDTNHKSVNLLNFPIFPTTNEFSIIYEHDVDLEKEEAQAISHAYEIDKVIQPLISKPIHTTPPKDDYVALTTKSILDELLEEFKDEILKVTIVDEEADFNPTKDIKELERLLAKNPQSHFTEIQVDDEVACDGGCCLRKQTWCYLYKHE